MWPSQNIRTLTENPLFCFFEDGTRRKRHSEILVNFVNTAWTVNCVISRSFCSFVLIRSFCRVQDKCKGVICKKKLGSTKRLLQKFIITKSWKSWIHDHEKVVVLKIEFFDPQETLKITQMGPLWLYNSQTRAERRSFSAMIALYSSPILTVHPWRAHVQQQQYTLLLLFLKYTVCVDNKRTLLVHIDIQNKKYI